MVQEFPPTFPKLGVEQAINVMVMNGLQRLEKLMSGMKKPGLIFRRQRLEILKPPPPNTSELGVFHEWLGHIPQRRGGCVHGRDTRNSSAAPQLHGEI